MTEQETRKILAILYTSYKRELSILNQEEKNIWVRLWTKAFANVPLERVLAALETYIMTDRSGFAPSIGAINGILHEAEKADVMSDDEAWRLVRKAVRNSIHHADKEWAKLPPLVQKAVGNISRLKELAWYDDIQMDKLEQSFKRSYNEQVNFGIAAGEIQTSIGEITVDIAGKFGFGK